MGDEMTEESPAQLSIDPEVLKAALSYYELHVTHRSHLFNFMLVVVAAGLAHSPLMELAGKGPRGYRVRPRSSGIFARSLSLPFSVVIVEVFIGVIV